jgi:hypothetical protein
MSDMGPGCVKTWTFMAGQARQLAGAAVLGADRFHQTANAQNARTFSDTVGMSQMCQERKHSQPLRKAAARSAETICVTIGEILRAFMPTECANYFRNSGYAQS